MLAIAGCGAKVASLRGDLAGGNCNGGPAVAGVALEHIIVDAAELAFRGNGLAGRWIPYHQVGIRTHCDRALAWVDIEDARDIRRSHRDKLFFRQTAAVDAGGPEHRQAVFETTGSVGDLAEIVEAEPLLRRRKRTMIGRYHLKRAGLQSRPQPVLLGLVPARRR